MIDPTALADWNAANTRARRAYYDSPTALGDLLSKTCRACRDRKHSNCTGRIRGSGPCTCHTDRHIVIPEARG